jgi:hypothetical protein
MRATPQRCPGVRDGRAGGSLATCLIVPIMRGSYFCGFAGERRVRFANRGSHSEPYQNEKAEKRYAND